MSRFVNRVKIATLKLFNALENANERKETVLDLQSCHNKRYWEIGKDLGISQGQLVVFLN